MYTCKLNDKFKWIVLETKTDNVIKAFDFESDARKLARFLRRGGGFFGFTPAFFCVEFETITEDINEKFEEFLEGEQND